MTDAPTTEPRLDDVAYDDASWHSDDEQLPRRPRRRLVTPWTLGLSAVLIAALGFLGGVQVQKGQQPSTTGGGGGAGLRAAAAGGGTQGAGARGGFGGQGAGGQTGATPTAGTVTSKDGRTLYVKDSSGNTVKVRTTSNSKVTRTASTSAGAIHPGDTVIVQGTANDAGTVTATSVTATASGVSLFGGGFPGGGFGGGGGAAPTGGAAPAAGGGAGGG